MLTITVSETEFFDESSGEFIHTPAKELQFEHSLVSLSKWESNWEKPFLGKEAKTTEETYDYLRAMCLTPDVPDEVFNRLPSDAINQVSSYIEARMSATWFNDQKRPSREIITSEIIYYWMISMNIPMECQHWHLNRLLTLIKVCGQKNSPQKKMGRNDILARNRMLNEQRKAQLNTAG